MTQYDPKSSEATFAYLEIQPGATIKLTNGAVAEVIANPKDGAWLMVRFLEHPDASRVGQEDMVFFTDVEGGG